MIIILTIVTLSLSLCGETAISQDFPFNKDFSGREGDSIKRSKGKIPATKLSDSTTSSNAKAVENVFIMVIDGLKNTEAFDDPTHQYIPRIWNDLRPLGTIYRNFYNMGQTGTTSGHTNICSGVVQFLPNILNATYDPIVIMQEEPSIFQYYRSQLHVPEDKTWIINGKGEIIQYVGNCLYPVYSNRYLRYSPFFGQQNGAIKVDLDRGEQR